MGIFIDKGNKTFPVIIGKKIKKLHTTKKCSIFAENNL